MSEGTSETHDVGGLAVTRRWGDPALPTIVLVHGTMDRATSFSRVLRRLDDLDVVLYDRRGYEGSQSDGAAADLEGHAADLLSVIEWSSAASVLVVGHSYGGLVALRAAARGKGTELGERMMAVGSFEAPMPWRPEYGNSGGMVALEAGRREGPAAAAEVFYRAVVGDRAWERLGEPGRAVRLAEGSAVMADVAAASEPDAAPVPVEVPVHSARGTESRDNLRWAAGELAEQFGTPLSEIRGAGHGAHLSHPGQFAQWVERLIAADRGW